MGGRQGRGGWGKDVEIPTGGEEGEGETGMGFSNHPRQYSTRQANESGNVQRSPVISTYVGGSISIAITV